mmetsp:Transcript_2331/g.8552  ORF Transcript_2331/g.8552 Transcript_2331/m.8552 type:complete len:193 (-) Transcript_2331:1741-2319(-)
MEATCTKPTPVNLAQHAYWNLGGHDSGDILDHKVRLAATKYLPVDKELIPTGEQRAVRHTSMDFGAAHAVGMRINAVPGGGYDHCYCLGGPNASRGVGEPPHPPRLAASIHDPASGRAMDLLTDAPGVVFYTGNFLDGALKGKGGYAYQKHAGLCLETQWFPDGVNQPGFPNTVLQPDQTYEHLMVHRFYTR